MRRFLKPGDVLSFGKNKGLTLKEVYQYEPTYIEWLIINTDDITIDIEAFENLPTPTPLAIGAVSGSVTRRVIGNSRSSIFHKMRLTDNVNMHTDVRELKKMAEDYPELLKEVNFRFSMEAREKNNNKINAR
jgi:hypothetical protein